MKRTPVIKCLQAIRDQDYPEDRIEILVSDGMSVDGTREKIDTISLEDPRVHLIDNPGQIVPTGMNAALAVANGEIIIRIDGHTIIAPDYVIHCVETLIRTGADNVGGRMNANGKSHFGRIVSMATSSPFGVGGARFHYADKEEWVDTVYMGAWPRRIFEQIGLYDEELVRDQDDEFNYRLREYGGRILLSPKIKSVYSNRSNPSALWRQYFLYGLYKVRVLQKHPRQMRLSQFIPPTFVATIIVSLLMGLLSPLSWLFFALIFGTYIIACLTTSIIISNKNGWEYLPLLLICFAILHLSYGLGFLRGLIKFWNRWGDKVGKQTELRLANACSD